MMVIFKLTKFGKQAQKESHVIFLFSLFNLASLKLFLNPLENGSFEFCVHNLKDL